MDWELEEEILLVSLFYKCRALSEAEKNDLIRNLSEFLIYRAKLLNYEIDETFRNVVGIKMKLKNILFFDTNGSAGLSQYSKLDKEIMQLYNDNKQSFDEQLKQITDKYKLDENYKVYYQNKQKFYDWLTNTKKSHITERSFLLLCEVDQYALNTNISKVCIWDIKLDDFEKYRDALIEDAKFNCLNKSVHCGYSIALGLYEQYLLSVSQSSALPMASDIVETYVDEATTPVAKSVFSNDYLFTLRDEFKAHIHRQHPEWAEATLNIHRTDAYFLANNVVGISLSEAIASDESILVARDMIRDYLRDVNKVLYPDSGANAYMNSLKLFRDFCLTRFTPTSNELKDNIDPIFVEKVSKVISTHFTNGFRNNSPIELSRFRSFYFNLYDEEMLSSDEELLKYITACGITVSGKVYMVSTESTDMIKELVKQYFDYGARAIFYAEFYAKNESWLFDASVVSEDMLILILRRLFPKLMFTQTYFGYTDASVFVTLESEILRVWEDDLLLSYGQLAERLKYIPIDRIKSALGQNGDFVWNSVGTFAHISRIEITEEEREVIRETVVRECNVRGYAAITILPLENIKDRYYELTDTAIYSAIYRICLSDKFDKRDKIITRKGDDFDALTIMKEYCRTIDKCTLDDLLNHEKELTGEAQRWLSMEAGSLILVRIDEDTYVSNKYVHFDTDAIDAAIGLYVKGDYLPLLSFTTFGAFPSCGQPWNLFLLESYCRRFSPKFRFDALSINSRNAGVVIRKSCMMDYTEIMTDAVINANIPLSKTTVDCFLFDNGYTGRHTNARVSEIINKVKAVRERRA